MPHIGALFIYPLKSARGVAVDEIDLDDRGPAGDRRWMLVDERNNFLSQREIPRLSLIVPRLTSQGLAIDAPGMDPHTVSQPGQDAEEVTGTVWDGACRVRVASNDASDWCSRFLGRPVRLVFQPDDAILPMSRDYAGGITAERRIALTDGSPLLLIGRTSLDDLNSRLPLGLPMNRFRPNLVVEGTAPYAEDGWQRIQVGGVTIEISKPCPRCATTTVDQATGERGVEPLKTLATYRKVGSNVHFGMNAAHHGPGRIRRGDRVVVVS